MAFSLQFENFMFEFFSFAVIVPTLPNFRRRVEHKTFQSKHHHDHHWGPFFEEPLNTSGTLQVGFHYATEAILNCRVGMLKDKTVSTFRCFPPQFKTYARTFPTI